MRFVFEVKIVPVLKCGDGRHIAYERLQGKSPGVVFLSGFKSDMTGSKATFLEALCRRLGQSYVRFDYTGHGKSSGRFEDGAIGDWRRDALDVIDELTQGEQILVGSSMGGWLMLLAALARPERTRALLGLAVAPDFTERLVWQAFTPQQQEQLMNHGQVMIPDCYGAEPYPITRRLVEEGRNHLLLHAPVEIHCPVRLIHGTADDDVPYSIAQMLLEKMETKNARLELIKGAGHRLSEPQELAVLERHLLELL